MSDIFDLIAERICSNCINGNDMCAPDTKDCPFSGDFGTLQKICADAQTLAESIEHAAQEDYWAAAQYAYECGDY